MEYLISPLLYGIIYGLYTVDYKPFTIRGMHIQVWCSHVMFSKHLQEQWLAGLYTKDFPLMLTYSSATLRRLKDSMTELHDHFWRENYKFPQFLCQNSQEPPNWLLQSGWKTAGWRGSGIEQLPDFARFHKIGAIDRHRRTDMKHMHRYSKAFCLFIAILFPFIYLWMFLCTNVDRSIEPHVCKFGG